MKKVLVTGGNGRLGNVLVRQLLEDQHQVEVLLAPHHQDKKPLEGLEVQYRVGDVRDRAALAPAIAGKEWVFHLAAKIWLHPDKDKSTEMINREGARLVAELCLESGVERLIHCSSHHALSMEPQDQPVDENNALALDEVVTYHRTKAEGEVAVLEQVKKGLDAVIVNPGSIIGPHDYAPSLFVQALSDFYNGKIPFLMEGMTDYADVRDISRAIIQAAHKGRTGERYLLTGWMVDMKDLPALVEKVSGKKMPKRILPLWLMYTLLPLIQLGSRVSGKPALFTRDMLKAAQSNPVISHEKARKELNYQPRSLEDTFKATLDWCRQMNWIKD
ncbi:MAG: NAD-dependent epimerase/dehydratase family protein [Bacteroidota bacterium]